VEIVPCGPRGVALSEYFRDGDIAGMSPSTKGSGWVGNFNTDVSTLNNEPLNRATYRAGAIVPRETEKDRERRHDA
jgi:hypothetical protein